jgi:hypothetical protein
LISKAVAEKIWPVKFKYDLWEQKYVVETLSDKVTTRSDSTLIHYGSFATALPILELKKLEQRSSYYISVQITFQPVSEETYNELHDWLVGKSSHGERRSVQRGRFFSFLTDLLGLGDKTVQEKSKIFTVREGRLLFQ